MLTPGFAPIQGAGCSLGTQLGHERLGEGHCRLRRQVRVQAFVRSLARSTSASWPPPGTSRPATGRTAAFAQANLPVVGISCIDAGDVLGSCPSEQDDRPVRLPTEAEWGICARGLQEALFPWGDVMPEWIPNGGRGPLPAPWPVHWANRPTSAFLGSRQTCTSGAPTGMTRTTTARSPERNPGPRPRRATRRAGGAWRRAHDHVPRHLAQ